ncbi:MAG: methyltransferase domain-containing protein [Chloroflexi bacterium]|nr:methyltransferase domain-containing protein [Chloroflexota bacterium]
MASLRFRCRQVYWSWVAPGRIRNYINGSQIRKLQIGSGSNLLPDWLNTTLYPFAPGTVFLNACLPFPVPDDSFDYVFSEHVIEHLEFEDCSRMLRECHRILRDGGRIRLATPDLERIIALYTRPDGRAQQHYIRWIMDNFRPQVGEYSPAHVINQSFHGWRHKFIYDGATLSKALQDAGFVGVDRVEPGQSGDANLRGIEQHGQYVGSEEAMRYETMVIEAVKAQAPRGQR